MSATTSTPAPVPVVTSPAPVPAAPPVVPPTVPLAPTAPETQATPTAPVVEKRGCEICKQVFIPDADDLHICHACQKKSKGKRFWILYMAELTVALIVIVPLWSDTIVRALEATGLLQGETGFTIKVTVQALLGTMILVLRKVYTTPANTAEAAVMQQNAAANPTTAPTTALGQKLQASNTALTQQATDIQSAATSALTPTAQTPAAAPAK